jgi:integrase
MTLAVRFRGLAGDWKGIDMATKRRVTGKLHLLTARGVLAAGAGDHSDGGGLFLRVNGPSVNWVLRYTAPSGRRREAGLGVVHRSSLALAGDSLIAARDAAREARDLLRVGVDPLAAREQKRVAERVAIEARKAERAKDYWTLARASRDYHQRVIEPTRTPKHSAQWISSLENHVPAGVWNAPISSITAPLLLTALTQIGHHERARNVKGVMPLETIRRIRQRLDAVFEDCVFYERCAANPAAAIRRKMTEELPAKDSGKFAALPYKEAPAVIQRLRGMPGTSARCLEFAVLTASRTSEALGARWAELDLQAGTWLVDATRMKAKEDHLVHLSPRAVEIIRGQLGQHTELVFPSAWKEDSALSNMSMLVLLKRMRLKERTTVHGLCRATFSTWANETAAARPDVIEACLAHEEGNRVRASYNRASFNADRKLLLLAWSGYLARPPAQVLPFAAAFA